jgi:hypothetical protein
MEHRSAWLVRPGGWKPAPWGSAIFNTVWAVVVSVYYVLVSRSRFITLFFFRFLGCLHRQVATPCPTLYWGNSRVVLGVVVFGVSARFIWAGFAFRAEGVGGTRGELGSRVHAFTNHTGTVQIVEGGGVARFGGGWSLVAGGGWYMGSELVWTEGGSLAASAVDGCWSLGSCIIKVDGPMLQCRQIDKSTCI